MHLIFENLVPNLIQLWTHDFKDLGSADDPFVIRPTIWQAVGAATASCGPTIPYSFCSRPQNIATDKSQCTADAWSFWLQYIAPVVLENRFTEDKYYWHFIDLVKLVRTCLQFEMQKNDIEFVRRGFEQWVEKYEQFYYQHDPLRIATCPITIHALLHIADSIDATGPVWTAWAFPMERFCGSIQPAIKNRRYPYASMSKHVTDEARLTQVQLLYNLQDELSFRANPHPQQCFVHSNYPTCILLPPRMATAPEPSVLKKIIAALATRYDASATRVQRICSAECIKTWGKVRRLDGGDTMHAAGVIKPAQDSRDATFVRYETLVDKYARQKKRQPEYEMKTFYGQLQHIFVVSLPLDTDLCISEPTVHILASIKTCKVERSNAALDIHYYSKLGGLDILDITCIQCVVGRISCANNSWAIIDRSGDLARAFYVPETGDE